MLQSAEIARLVDVRRHPGSRRHPHLGRDALEAALRSAGVEYDWRGEELGGRRKGRPDSRHPAWRNASFRAYADHMDTDEFRQAMHKLLAEARQQNVAVMCAETLWWRCHRRLIADAAVLAGEPVLHLFDVGKHEPHRLHEAARRDDEGFPVYDAGEGPLF